MEEGLIQRLMSSVKCSSCGQHHKAYDIDVLGHNDDIWFLQVHCSSCHSRSLVAAIIKETRTARVISDLTQAEMDKLFHSEAVTGNDVLDMRSFLSSFDGDFSRIFGQK